MGRFCVIFIFYFFYFFYTVNAPAGLLNCSSNDTVSEQLDVPYLITPSAVTIGATLPDYTVIYSLNKVRIAQSTAQCLGDAVASVILTLREVEGGADISQNGFMIYPTSVSGVGISVNSSNGQPIAVWPDRVVTATFPINAPQQRINNFVNIRLWKIPGELPPGEGVLSIVGPGIVQGIFLENSNDSFSKETEESHKMRDGIWVLNSRYLYSRTEVHIGTCNLAIANKIFHLGKHPFHSRFSDWKDASFNLSCDTPAYGYGGSVSGATTAGAPTNGVISANNKNLAPNITVYPLTQEITRDELGNHISGTIGIESLDARGYGIQLAWGKPSEQNSGLNPDKGVEFNIPVPLNILVSGYATSINLGSLPSSALVNMSARFIQIDSDVQPGQAKGAVEMVVSYQ